MANSAEIGVFAFDMINKQLIRGNINVPGDERVEDQGKWLIPLTKPTLEAEQLGANRL